MIESLLPYRHKSNLWDDLELIPFSNNNWNGAIIYLDRDGVINRGSENYINSPEELELLPQVAESLSKLRNAGFRLCLVTNQSPINRGLWTHKVLEEIHEKLIIDLMKIDNNAFLDLILYSPYAPSENSISRKPSPGMLMAGNVLINTAESNITLSTPINELSKSDLFKEHHLSSMVGDRFVDYQAGKSHGVRTYLVNPEIGLTEVVDRILDKNDKGDALD
tara:strand:+ start:14 stop:676 length:663 start_codon:yes stop_codon:yes gene_type:complete